MTDNTSSAILISSALGVLCLAAAPLIGALCAALVEGIAGPAYSLGEGRTMVRILAAGVAGLAIALLINGIVLLTVWGRVAPGRLYLITAAIALVVYAVILAVRLLQEGSLEHAFVVREMRDNYVRLATGLYLVYGPAVAVGYAAMYWAMHLVLRQPSPS